MDLHKLTQDICAATKHWHLPLLAGMIGSIRINRKDVGQDEISDLGDLGDNVPTTLIISLSSRRGL